MPMDGKIAIVTGGAGGIGRAIAKRFLHDGARVMIADWDSAAGAEAVSELEAFGAIEFVKADIGKRLDVHNLVAAAVDAFGDIDILVNNAGVSHSAGFLDIREDDFDAVLQTNLKGPFLCGQEVARYMVDKGREWRARPV